jgi:hypothetical protein
LPSGTDRGNLEAILDSIHLEPQEGRMRTLLLGALGLTLALAATPARADEKGGQKDVSVTGEVVDTFCYSAMGARGSGHKQCGLDCAKKGIPVGLVEKGTDKLYVLLPNKDKEPVPQTAVDKMGETVTVTGHTYAKGGSNFLTVESVK